MLINISSVLVRSRFWSGSRHPVLASVLILALLPIAKAILLNLQLHHGATEVTATDVKASDADADGNAP